MAEERPSGGETSSFNLNGVLAVLTLAGGLWLVSHKLTSSRPVVPAGGTQPFIGEQTLEARLWEDPFKADENGGGGTNWGLHLLVEQIRERNETPEKVLLLPVMVAGGNYGEDQESRIRSRNAVVSALAQSGYAPEDAEHLGALTIQWPTGHEVDEAKRKEQMRPMTNLWAEGSNNILVLGTNASGAAHMDLRYEWYRRQETISLPVTDSWSSVLVLWLDDSFFEDQPLLRLPLLLKSLSVLINDKPPATSTVPIALIGPRRSATLYAMLRGLTNTVGNTYVQFLAKSILTNISVYCATPSAMDEVLVALETNASTLYEVPRAAVTNQFHEQGFKRAHNFAATDAQLAHEAFAELALSHTDLADTNNHLVLISEWDTFYARALALTYAAELAVLQHSKTNRKQILDELSKGQPMPTNFHSFVYLRGLDGQTVKGEGATEEGRNAESPRGKSAPASFEEVRNWTPDVNKAEGRAQLDYLNRLGDRLEELRTRLHREDRGKIEAIGIVGSDVYDILLILQAMRNRFPEARFFTTDLDARFCQPRERPWTRDLLVVSAYGLELHPTLQGSIAPFRDSTQTAQFAATLAALGDTNLQDLTFVPPRRFEMGNGAIVDLSVSNALMPLNSRSANLTNGPWLHPLTLSEKYPFVRPHIREHSIKAILYSLVLLAAGFLLCGPLYCFIFQVSWSPGEALVYAGEDVGGPVGAEVLLNELQAGKGQDLKRMLDLDRRSAVTQQDPDWQTRALVLGLNKILKSKKSPLAPESDWNELSPPFVGFAWRRAFGCLKGHYLRRRWIDGRLDELSAAATPPAEPPRDILCAAKMARDSASQIFRLRWERLLWFVVGAAGFAVLGIGLGYCIWSDTLKHPTGEPFSLTNGASDWPAEILRLLICFAVISCIFSLYWRLREAFFELTREFRLSPPKKEEDNAHNLGLWREATFLLRRLEPPESADGACAKAIWQEYREHGRGSRRLLRVLFPIAAYVGLCALTFWLFEADPFDDVRGDMAWWVNRGLVVLSGVLFVVQAFLTIDASLLCRRFIRDLGAAPTRYPEATYQHFSSSLGEIQPEYLDEWIDLQLIAEVTERVGRLVYYPCWLLLALVLARNGWWDTLSWPTPLILVFAFNVVLALASAVTLQLAARRAKRYAERSLDKKVQRLQAGPEPSARENQANQASRLLDEIRDLRRGAFVPFWQNPVVGAIFASSGSMTLIQLAIWFMGR